MNEVMGETVGEMRYFETDLGNSFYECWHVNAVPALSLEELYRVVYEDGYEFVVNDDRWMDLDEYDYPVRVIFDAHLAGPRA